MTYLFYLTHKEIHPTSHTHRHTHTHTHTSIRDYDWLGSLLLSMIYLANCLLVFLLIYPGECNHLGNPHACTTGRHHSNNNNNNNKCKRTTDPVSTTTRIIIEIAVMSETTTGTLPPLRSKYTYDFI